MNAFVDGLAQFFVPTHLLAVGALGLLAGQGGRSLVALSLFAFGLFAGSFAIAWAVGETPSALVLLGVAAVAGMVIAAAISLPSMAQDMLAFVAGAALAFNAPPQAITVRSAVAEQIGTSVAAFAAFAAIVLVSMHAERAWQRIALRVVGSWIAASGILALALRLAR